MELIKEFQNDLLKRKELNFRTAGESNPGFEDCMKKIAGKLKVLEENVAVKSVRNNFGRKEFLIEAFVYDTKEDKERIEPKSKSRKKEGVKNG